VANENNLCETYVTKLEFSFKLTESQKLCQVSFQMVFFLHKCNKLIGCNFTAA